MTTEEGERPTSILKWSTRQVIYRQYRLKCELVFPGNPTRVLIRTVLLYYYTTYGELVFSKRKTYLMIFDDDKIIKIFKNYKNIVKGENPHTHTTERQQLFIVCTVFLWIQSPRQGGRCRAVTAAIHCLLITQHGTCGQLERPRCATQLTLLST